LLTRCASLRPQARVACGGVKGKTNGQAPG